MSKPQIAHLHLPPMQITLAEGDAPPREIQLLKTGKFSHAKYGDFSITPAMLLQLKENHEKNVRGCDLALDFSHNSEGEAAAWIKKIDIRENGTQLWAEVEWTGAGQKSVASKEFRYVSADLTGNFVNNETKQAHGPTLLGAGLTNRPVIKGMAPVFQLSEVDETAAKENSMNEEQIKAMQAENDQLKKQCAEQAKQLSELTDAKKKSDEEKKLAEEQKQLAEKKSEFDLKLSEGVVCEAQREAFMAGDMAKFIANAQPVKLAENGNGGGEDKNKGKKAEDEILELAEKKSKEAKIDIGAATSMVLSENPKLRERYEKGE